jgi:hypothetical protein
MKKLILSLAFSLCALTHYGQVVLGYFPFNYGEVQLTSPQSALVFADLRIETNSFITNLNMELGGAVNLKRAEKHNLYLGVGLRGNPFDPLNETSIINGYYVSMGVRWRPVKSVPKLGLVFELSPLFYEELGSGLALRSKLGLSYAF